MTWEMSSWMIWDPTAPICYIGTIRRTRREAIAARENEVLDIWKTLYRRGERAVRVHLEWDAP